jgi:hypothetical protein
MFPIRLRVRSWRRNFSRVAGRRGRIVTLFSAVSGEQVRQAQIVTGLAMAAFISVGVVPGLRPYAARIRLVLLVVYLLACAAFVTWVLLR